MKRFADKVVLITGASLGVGRAVAHAFFKEGARVALLARRAAPLEAVAAELGDPDRVMVLPADVADADSLQAALDAVQARWGRLDGLVNNAGAHYRGLARTRSAEEIATMVDVNLRAPLVLTRLALPLLEADGGGFVVNVGSLAGKLFLDGSATYSATKWGLRAFTRALSEELREAGIPVTVSCVNPGPIETGFILEELETVTDITLSQDMCTAEDVAGWVLECATTGEIEKSWPPSGSRLATLAYLFPGLRRLLKPRLEAKGRARRAALKARMAAGELDQRG